MKQGEIQKYIKQLKSRYQHVRKKAVDVLFWAGPNAREAVPALIEALKDKDREVRKNVAMALGKFGPDAGVVVPALIEALEDKDREVRENVAMALGKIGPDAREAVPALIEALEDKYRVVRAEVAIALGQIGPDAREAVPALIEALEDKGIREVRKWAVFSALGQIGPDAREAVPALIETLKNKHVRLEAASALRDLGRVEDIVFETLKECLKSEVQRVDAVEVLGSFKDERAIEPLIEALAHEEPHVRSAAVEALGKFKDERIVELLIKALEVEDWGSTTANIIRILGEKGDGRAIKPLEKIMNDPKRSERPLYPWSPMDDYVNLHAEAQEAIGKIRGHRGLG